MDIVSFNPGLTFFTWIVFGIVLGLMSWFGWGPIVEVLRKREEKIQDDVTTAEEEREKAEQLRQERQEELNEAHSEAREIVENGRRKAEEEKQRIVGEAEDRAESMIQDAEDEITRKRRETFEEIQSHVGTLAVDLAGKLVREKIDEEDHRELVDEFLEEVQAGGMKVG